MAGAHVPAAHATQPGALAADHDPAAQTVQFAAPAADHEPAAQLAQLAAFASAQVPAAQDLQLVARPKSSSLALAWSAVAGSEALLFTSEMTTVPVAESVPSTLTVSQPLSVTMTVKVYESVVDALSAAPLATVMVPVLVLSANGDATVPAAKE